VVYRAAPNPEPREDIWPTEGPERVHRFAAQVSPARPKGPPVINFRSAGRRFPTGRCLVPASHFFEFTRTRSPVFIGLIHAVEALESGSDRSNVARSPIVAEAICATAEWTMSPLLSHDEKRKVRGRNRVHSQP